MASLPLRGKSLMDIEPPPLPPQKGLQFLESEVGRVSNVEEVINVLKSDEEEYYQMIKVINFNKLKIYILLLIYFLFLGGRRRNEKKIRRRRIST